MRIEARARVDADLALSKVAGFKDEQFLYELHPNSDGLLGEIRVSMGGAKGPSFETKQLPNGRGHHHLSLNDGELANELRETLIYIESMGTVLLAIRQIHWDATVFHWIPEGDEPSPSVLSFSDPEMNYPRTIHSISPTMFARVMAHRQEHQHLVTPFSFLRQGFNDHEAHRYINAFANFFLFIEHLYADGHSRRNKMLAAFKSKRQLVAAVEETTKKLRQPDQARHREKLQARLEPSNRKLDVDGVLWLLVDVRGLLNHSSAKDSRQHAGPLTHHAFRSESYLALSIATHCQLFRKPLTDRPRQRRLRPC